MPPTSGCGQQGLSARPLVFRSGQLPFHRDSARNELRKLQLGAVGGGGNHRDTPGSVPFGREETDPGRGRGLFSLSAPQTYL